ncbi:hypothetical protein G6F42_026257 [Rhizopus arrhizus]|nr:hypothetical protein G6F42_026257 [Rhizopus arrhizus]
MIDELVHSLDKIWTRYGFKRLEDWSAQGGCAGVGVENAVEPTPMWTDKQLGLDKVVDSQEAVSNTN